MNQKLTYRERQVLEMMAYGNSIKEVACLLNVSVNTVETHIKRIKLKTGLQKITELEVAWFYKKYRLPIIDIPDRLRQTIAAALLALSLFSVVIEHGNMLRVMRAARVKTQSASSTRRGGRKRDGDFCFELEI